LRQNLQNNKQINKTMSDVEDVPETQLEIDVSDGAGLEDEDDDDMEQITAQKVR